MNCDHCEEPFEPRKGGKPQRFCSGGRCREAFHAEARRKGAKALRRRSPKHRPRTPTIDEKLSLFKRSILIAQQLDAAEHEVVLYTRYSGNVNIEFWPTAMPRSKDMATYLIGDAIYLVDEDGNETFEYESVPSRGTFNEFRFLVDMKDLSLEEAAALLAVTAQPGAFGAQN